MRRKVDEAKCCGIRCQSEGTLWAKSLRWERARPFQGTKKEPKMSRAVVPKVRSTGSPRPCQEVGKVKTVFIITLRYLLFAFFVCVDIYRNGAKARVGKIAGALQ